MPSILHDEIYEQPVVVQRLLERELHNVQKDAADLRGTFDSILIAARGTSDNAARYAQYLFGAHNRLPVGLATPSLYTLYNQPPTLKRMLVIGISQSGQSPDIVSVLAEAKRQGQPTLAITNDPASPLAQTAASTIALQTGPEKAVAATKTYTGQMLMFYLLAYALGGKIGIPDLERLPEAVEGALRLEPEIDALSERYRYMRHAVVVGRGLNYANAFELSLKLMETCYVVTERFSSADFMHGPIAMVEPSFPVFAFAPPDVTWPSLGGTLEKLKSLRAEIVAITDSGNREVEARATRVIRLPRRLKPWFTPIPYIVPAQLFAAFLAAQKASIRTTRAPCTRSH